MQQKKINLFDRKPGANENPKFRIAKAKNYLWAKMNFLFFLIFLMLFSLNAFSQKEQFDMVRFNQPTGWQRHDGNGTVIMIDTQTVNGLTQFCQIILYPGRNSTGSANKDFKSAWNNLVTIPTQSKAKPAVQKSSSEGWTIITGSANIISKGIQYKTLVTSISGFGKTIPVQVNTAGGDYAAAVEKFFNELDLDKNTTPSISSFNKITMNDYDFITPEGWQMQKKPDHLAIQNLQSGCIIQILAPQPSSGNLSQDATAVFDMMYKGWNYQQTGEKQFLLAKGFLPGGLEFFRKEATMSGYTADGQYNLEEGSAMVVKAGNNIAIISMRHNSSSLGHDACYKNYNTVARFLNSFTVKSLPVTLPSEDNAKRILGVWKLITTGVAAGEYIFAANGHYQHGAGLGSSTTTTDMNYEYIYNRAYTFQGDGSYSISKNMLTLAPKGGNPETIPVRFEAVSYGSNSWSDRIYMLKKEAGIEYESMYEKQNP